MNKIITIDGPAGTGKTTVAKKIAKHLGYHYFETGAMYRALTYKIIKESIDLNNTHALQTQLKDFHFEIETQSDGSFHYYVQEEDVTTYIYSPEITAKVSEIAAHPLVRDMLVNIQRQFGKEKNAVFEGRDMGTVVFPNAFLKIFLTALPEVRAKRRYQELKGQSEIQEEHVLKDLLKRDLLDSTREHSPLKQATDAHLIDTSNLTIDEVVQRIVFLASRSPS